MLILPYDAGHFHRLSHPFWEFFGAADGPFRRAAFWAEKTTRINGWFRKTSLTMGKPLLWPLPGGEVCQQRRSLGRGDPCVMKMVGIGLSLPGREKNGSSADACGTGFACPQSSASSFAQPKEYRTAFFQPAIFLCLAASSRSGWKVRSMPRFCTTSALSFQ